MTGTTVSYTFRVNSYKDVLDKVLELMPSNWYYYIGLGDNTVYFRERAANPKHLFYLGKHIKAEDVRGSILDVKNHVLFTGGGDPALFRERKVTPAARTRYLYGQIVRSTLMLLILRDLWIFGMSRLTVV